MTTEAETRRATQTGGSDLNALLGDPMNAEQKGILPVYEKIRAEVKWLFGKAMTGDREAFRHLLRMSIWTTQLIDQVKDAHAELAKSVAEEHIFWPVAISASKEFPQKLNELRKSLEIGKRSQSPFSITRRFGGKWFTDSRKIIEKCLLVHETYKRLHFFVNGKVQISQELEALNTEVQNGVTSSLELDEASKAIHNLKQIQAICERGSETYNRLLHDLTSGLGALLGIVAPAAFAVYKAVPVLKEGIKLPPHTAETNEAWFLWVVNLIMACTGGQPEKNVVLQTIGKSGRPKSYRQKSSKSQQDKDVEALRKKKPMQGSEESNMWDTAYRCLWSAFLASISPELATPSKKPPRKPASSIQPITTVMVVTHSMPPQAEK